MTPAEIAAVELAVNRAILTDTNIGTIETSQDMAKQMGAMALFGEKYGEKVRVVVVGDISKELCGGTHVGSTGEIGQFKIIAESSVGSGLRRIEAVTGLAALEYVNQREDMLEQAAQLLKTRPEELVADIEAALGRLLVGTYGYSVESGRPIPRERLEAIPWATVLVEEKIGGIGRR